MIETQKEVEEIQHVKIVEVVMENELTTKKNDHPIMHEGEKNLGETKKKKKRTQKRNDECLL